ncbi:MULTISPECIES: GNAT family N-acetyltransferase [Pseudomonas]|uniref:GNAT family N-acetyltransferase n=3 Tax=Pseudomonas TaxID=286 RepID=A0ABX6HDQ2_9PSED|nr:MULTISPECIES: GNAT family N-acetyltransferase [Pseudomonas]MBC3953716.1 GNAT family N-acetyltransferase [Pseudomonas triticifolii]QHF03449.1 GNAT family N-acetyltransferase [Pseudomonas asturiensis]
MSHKANIKHFNDEIEDLTGDYWIETLRDGTTMLIRELADKDRDRDFTFFNNLGKGIPHFRFLGTFSELKKVHDQLMDVDLQNRVAYIALVLEDTKLVEIGAARYGAFEHDAHCEFAVAVCERWQRRGVATALMHHLMETAARKGFSKISSMDASANLAMDGLATSMGFTRRIDNKHGPRIFHERVLAG